MDGQPANQLSTADELVTRADVAQVERAIRLRWELPAELAKALPDRLVSLTKHSDGRIVCRAAKILLMMSQQNGGGQDDNSEPQGQIVLYIPRNGREADLTGTNG